MAVRSGIGYIYGYQSDCLQVLPCLTLRFTFQKCASFSHAEIFKYVFKYLVCGYFADDVVEVEDAFAEVLADEVA